jgi:hypothetical protein
MSTEQERFMAVAYARTLRAAQKAFKHWHSRKKADCLQECMTKMWYQWKCCLDQGKDPAAMIGPLIHWAIMHVRYDRKVSGRARGFDVQDYRSRMKQQLLSGKGEASPTDRSDRQNGWINWTVSARADDPSELGAALEGAGLSLEAWLDL